MGFTDFERKRLIEAYNEATASRNEISDLIYGDDGSRQDELEAEFEKQQKKVMDITAQYVKGLSVVPISRCPFTNTIVNHSIDTFGIDGIWWNYEAPARPAESLPETFFAMTGAMKLSESIEDFPFLCIPGPEVPFVIPRLLKQPEIKAVLSSIQVGSHQAFMIFYYSNPMLDSVERVNDWGTDSYSYENAAGESFWDSYELLSEDFDFNLEYWIREGKLYWITRGDGGLNLSGAVDGCPYLGLGGRTSVSYIRKGKIWW